LQNLCNRGKELAALQITDGETRHSQTRLNAGTERDESEKGKSENALRFYEHFRLPRLSEKIGEVGRFVFLIFLQTAIKNHIS
jgi:hypothetical protein